jgi:hypothetical protein
LARGDVDARKVQVRRGWAWGGGEAAVAEAEAENESSEIDGEEGEVLEKRQKGCVGESLCVDTWDWPA